MIRTITTIEKYENGELVEKTTEETIDDCTVTTPIINTTFTGAIDYDKIVETISKGLADGLGRV